MQNMRGQLLKNKFSDYSTYILKTGSFFPRLLRITKQTMDEQTKDEMSYKDIEQMIASSESVVGIDAKKTHIIIIQKLIEIEKRLKAIEEGH